MVVFHFGVGVYDTNGKKADEQTIRRSTGTNASAAYFNVGLKAGYQYFFMPIVGVRGYLGYDFNGSREYYERLKNLEQIEKI